VYLLANTGNELMHDHMITWTWTWTHYCDTDGCSGRKT